MTVVHSCNQCVFKVLCLNNHTVYKIQLPSALNLNVNDCLDSRVSPVRHLSLRRLGGSLTAWFLSAPVEHRPLCFSHYCQFLINIHPPPPMSIFLSLQFWHLGNFSLSCCGSSIRSAVGESKMTQ